MHKDHNKTRKDQCVFPRQTALLFAVDKFLTLMSTDIAQMFLGTSTKHQSNTHHEVYRHTQEMLVRMTNKHFEIAVRVVRGGADERFLPLDSSKTAPRCRHPHPSP
jgi:hypothetical protein